MQAPQLLVDVGIAHDRSGDQVREQRDERRVLEHPLGGFHLLPVDVDRVRHRVEGVEGDADRQHDVGHRNGVAAAGQEPEHGVDARREEPRVLEDRQHAEVEAQCRDEHGLRPPALVVPADDLAVDDLPGPVVDGGREQHQREQDQPDRDAGCRPLAAVPEEVLERARQRPVRIAEHVEHPAHERQVAEPVLRAVDARPPAEQDGRDQQRQQGDRLGLAGRRRDVGEQRGEQARHREPPDPGGDRPARRPPADEHRGEEQQQEGMGVEEQLHRAGFSHSAHVTSSLGMGCGTHEQVRASAHVSQAGQMGVSATPLLPRGDRCIGETCEASRCRYAAHAPPSTRPVRAASERRQPPVSAAGIARGRR